jgi:pimeloyl-ACP methyl ester carboxylesterase
MGLSKMKKYFMPLAIVILTIGSVFYFFTIQSFQQIEIARMKWNGIASVLTPEFHYFEKNNCKDTKNCQCVLLLHGLGDFALTWRKMLSLNKVDFSKDTHFFAPNLPGALSTPKLQSQDDYNIQKLAEKLSNYFLPRCESWVVVGNSYGGWLSIFMALQSEKVKGLLLLSPAGIKKDYSPILDYFLNPTVKGARDFYERLYAHPKQVPNFIFERVVARVKNQPVVEELKSIKEEDYLDSHLKDLKVPVHFVWGEADRVIPVTWAESYKEKTPKSQLKIIKDCGHVPQKECTMEVLPELNELLLQVK